MFIIFFLFLVSPFYFYFFIFYGLTHHPPPATRHPLPATRHPSPAEKSCRFCLRVRSAGGGELLPIHSLKWNPNDVLTTCKAISNAFASGFVYWSCDYVKNIDQRSWEEIACVAGVRKGRELGRETTREGGGRRGTPARKPLFSPSRLLIKKMTKITQLWMNSCQISLAAMHVY